MTFLLAARRWILKLAVAAAVAAAFLIYAIVRNGLPDGGKGVLAVIGIAAAAAPPLLLAAFWIVLGELVKLPERVRAMPAEGRALLDPAWWNAPRRFRVPRALWRAARARELLTPYAPLAPLASVPFLAATGAAAVAAFVEIVVACVVAIVLVVT